MLTSLSLDLLACPTRGFLRSRREILVGAGISCHRREPVLTVVMAVLAVREGFRYVPVIDVSTTVSSLASEIVMQTRQRPCSI